MAKIKAKTKGKKQPHPLIQKAKEKQSEAKRRYGSTRLKSLTQEQRDMIDTMLLRGDKIKGVASFIMDDLGEMQGSTKYAVEQMLNRYAKIRCGLLI